MRQLWADFPKRRANGGVNGKQCRNKQGNNDLQSITYRSIYSFGSKDIILFWFKSKTLINLPV